MGVDMGHQSGFEAPGAEGAAVRLQYAALCWREGEAGVEVLLITSRDTGRWVIPKGWPMAGLAPEMAAAREAWEEAGAEGAVSPISLGRYGYLKDMATSPAVPCAVSVFGLRVEKLAKKFPERGERLRHWFSPKDAATLVQEPDLGELIRSFTPPVEGRLPPVMAASVQRRG